MNEFDCYTTEIYCVINIIFTPNLDGCDICGE